jgi:hypothetical protein
MTPQEEQDYLENRFAEACDDCGQGADDHAAWTNSQGVIVVDCTND